MTHAPVHLFDAEGTSVPTRAFLERRIAALEAENRKLKALVLKRAKEREPKYQPTIN